MKKLLTIIALAICSMTMVAQELHVGDLYYDIIPIEGGYAAEIVYHRSYKRLDSIAIPEYITYQGLELPIIIGNGAFGGCKKLADVYIPNTVIRIGYSAFYGTALYNDPANWENGALCIDGCLIEASEYIPEIYTIYGGVRLIADYAFEGCRSSLKHITIPASVKSIGEGILRMSKSATIVFNGTMEQWQAIDKVSSSSSSSGLATYVHCTDGQVLIICN